jgi:DeoR/GlpR family transcriptional regulator of sugar metabolism
MMESDLREAQMKRAMAETAGKVVGLVDHNKFDQVYVATSMLPEEIGLLIADNTLTTEQRASLEQAGIPFELV